MRSKQMFNLVVVRTKSCTTLSPKMHNLLRQEHNLDSYLKTCAVQLCSGVVRNLFRGFSKRGQLHKRICALS